jgi:alkylation response protein AidB-like acyl-CoA dehydrogenase
MTTTTLPSQTSGRHEKELVLGLTRSTEQDEWRKTVRAFFEDKSPEAEVRRLMETSEGYEPTVWSQMSEQLGIQGLAIPEEYGGSGYSFIELAIVFEEAGRRLLCAPLLSSLTAATTLLVSGDERAKTDLLPGIAAGTTIATLALTEPSGRWDQAGVAASAEASDGSWRVSGTKKYVLDGHIASLILVAARTPRGVSILAVEGDAPGVERRLLKTLDRTRKLASLDFSNTPARLVGQEGAGWAVLEQVLRRASVALANEQVGVAEFAMDMAVQYAKDRVAFGRPIGSFQAIKHKCADLLVAVESAKSAAHIAAQAVATNSPELVEVAEIAASFCSEACLLAGHENIQIHGGIAYTWEYPAHLYYKRAKSSELLFGDTIYHRELLAQAIGL